MSAEYNELVYGKYQKILTDTVSGGWGDVKVNQNETVKVYGGKMQWRGEMFLLTGKDARFPSSAPQQIKL